MLFSEIKIDEWDGHIEQVFDAGDFRLILLKLEPSSSKAEFGRCNLFKVDKENKIIWQVKAPKMSRSFSWCVKFEYKNQKLYAWYSGNVKVEINVSTGDVLNEKFIW
jgi:hypothetical protein